MIDHPTENERPAPDDWGPDHFSTNAPFDLLNPGDFSSSNVHSALYDFGEQELTIRYQRDGVDAIYLYFGVPASIWNGLVHADSKGGYINRHIAYEFTYSQPAAGGFPDRGYGVGHPLARAFVTMWPP